MRNVFLVIVDVVLGFFLLCVLPFAFLLRDGLGPDSVTTAGISALTKTLMTFYVGPVILLFVSFDLLLRRFGKRESAPATGTSTITWVASITGAIGLSWIIVHLVFG